MQSNFFNHLILISLFELKRNFATQKGILPLLTFSAVWYFILLYPIRFAAELLVQEKELRAEFSLFDLIGFGSIQHWSIPEFGVFWHFALMIFPMLSILLAADQTCSDRKRGTLRFIVIRSSRDRVFFGRFVGAMLIQTLWISAVTFSTFILVLIRDTSLIFSALHYLFILIINLIIISLPFSAMMAVLSAKVNSARQAILWAVLIWMFLAGIINSLTSYLPTLAFLEYLILGYQLSDMTQLPRWETLPLIYIPLLQSLFLLTIGRWIMLRQAL